MSNDSSAPPLAHRPIKSYVLRAGRKGSGQQRAVQELGPRFVCPYQAAPLNVTTAFGRTAPLVLEIGFGMGQATAEVALAQPQTNFLGVEVHAPGVGALLKRMGELGLSNIRIIQHDAVEVLTHMLTPASLAGVHIWFPDPWHKKRHHKRRLIQPSLVSLLASRLACCGSLHCATDWQPYAEQMLEVLGAESQLVNTAPSGGYAARPETRPMTKFELRGQLLGHGVWDLIYQRRADQAFQSTQPM